MNFEAFAKDAADNRWAIFGAQVHRDGKPVHSFGDTENRYPIYSATKTVTAIAAGMAADDGVLDIEQPVTAWLPQDVTGRMTASQLDAYRPVTIRRLMTMSVAGYPFRPEGSSWLMSSLRCPLENTERAAFEYSNIPAYLVGVAASCALDEDLYSYLDRRLFQPLGIIAPPCGRGADGYFYGASQMELSVSELSRIGMLLCSGGVYDGRRIVSARFVREMTSVQQENRDGGYGYFVWMRPDGFVISGKWKQKCYVLPDDGLVFTFLSHIEEDMPELTDSIRRNILCSRI